MSFPYPTNYHPRPLSYLKVGDEPFPTEKTTWWVRDIALQAHLRLVLGFAVTCCALTTRFLPGTYRQSQKLRHFQPVTQKRHALLLPATIMHKRCLSMSGNIVKCRSVCFLNSLVSTKTHRFRHRLPFLNVCVFLWAFLYLFLCTLYLSVDIHLVS